MATLQVDDDALDFGEADPPMALLRQVPPSGADKAKYEETFALPAGSTRWGKAPGQHS
jgi:hypothetical protein